MKHLKKFNNYSKSILEGRNKKVSFYDSEGKWFSSSDSISDIKDHQLRFGDDITFSVDGYEGRFKSIDDFNNLVKSNRNNMFSDKSIFSDREEAAIRVANKRDGK